MEKAAQFRKLPPIRRRSELMCFEDMINAVICGDAVELIRLIPDKSVDCIVTDPPYGLDTVGIKNDSDLSLFYTLLPQFHRVLKSDAFFLTFFSTKYLPLVFQNNPFTYFWQIVLYCPHGAVNSPVGYTKFMSCIVFKKGHPKVVVRNKDIFQDTPGRAIEPDEGFIDHPAPKPKAFIEELLRMFTRENDLVLDPFAGAGSTLVACKRTGRRFIGFELEEKFCSIARNRLQNCVARSKSFQPLLFAKRSE
jgi:DNA modification methylase